MCAPQMWTLSITAHDTTFVKISIKMDQELCLTDTSEAQENRLSVRVSREKEKRKRWFRDEVENCC